MIDGKILKFGYGDIAVGDVGFYMKLTPFKPPIEVGSECNGYFADGIIKPIGPAIMIKFEGLSDITEFRTKLESVCPIDAPKSFEFKGYTFDFSNYNVKSVMVAETILHNIRMNYLCCAAC